MNLWIVWIALAASVLFDISFGVLTKYSTNKADAGALAWWARLICAIIAGAFILPGYGFSLTSVATTSSLAKWNVWVLCGVSSVFLLLGEYFRWRSMQKGSDTACTLAVVELYPVLAGVLVLFLPVFGTNPTWKDITAFVFALTALLIANWPKGGKVTKEVFLGLLFMTIEISITIYGRLVMKIPTNELIFAISITGMIWFLPALRKVGLETIKWGTVTATVNMMTIIPFLWALGAAPPASKPIMLAVTSLSSTLGAITANVWFKDRWSAKKVLLIAFLCAASILTM
jgi:hypothetical protein